MQSLCRRANARRDDFGLSGDKAAPFPRTPFLDRAPASATLRILPDDVPYGVAFPITMRQNQKASVASLRSLDRLPEFSDRFQWRITDRLEENPHQGEDF